jgi:hypothetical protein
VLYFQVGFELVRCTSQETSERVDTNTRADTCVALLLWTSSIVAIALQDHVALYALPCKLVDWHAPAMLTNHDCCLCELCRSTTLPNVKTTTPRHVCAPECRSAAPMRGPLNACKQSMRLAAVRALRWIQTVANRMTRLAAPIQQLHNACAPLSLPAALLHGTIPARR